MGRSFILILLAVLLLGVSAVGAADTTSPSCTVFEPANTTLTNSSGVNFWIICGDNVINTSRGFTVNTTYAVNGTTALNTTMQIRGLNTSARNQSFGVGRHESGKLNGPAEYLTIFNYTVGETPENISRRWSMDATPPSTINISAPTNRTIIDNTPSLTCLSNEAGTMTASVDGGDAQTVSSTAVKSGSVALDSLSDAPHNVTCTVTDAAGNANTTAVIGFTVNSSSPVIRMVDPWTTTVRTFIGENRTFNITGNTVYNITTLTITFPSGWGVFAGLNSSDSLSTTNLSASTTVNVTTRTIVFTNISAAPIINSTGTDGGFLIDIGSNLTTPTSEDASVITFSYTSDDQTPIADDTVTIYPRNISKGPFYVSDDCGASISETRTANATSIDTGTSSQCNITAYLPRIGTLNSSKSNFTALGWTCSDRCNITNNTLNSAKFLKAIIKKASGDQPIVTITTGVEREIDRIPDGVAGAFGGAGLAAVVIFGFQAWKRRRDGQSG